jgi:ribonuclease BN (tRNA processing enzyme)
MEEAYASLFDTLDFALEYHELEPEKPLAFKGLTLSCARSGHSSPNFSLRVDAGGKSFFSSGDGHPTPETTELARGCDLAVHEAYAVDEKTGGHGTVAGTIDFGRGAGVRRLALAHLRAGVRSGRRAEIERLMEEVKDFEVFMPEPGRSVEF